MSFACINLILDIDETLLHTFVRSGTSPSLFDHLFAHAFFAQSEWLLKRRSYDDIQYIGVRHNDGPAKDMVVVLRPGVRRFLSQAADKVGNISIWSAGETSYVDFITKLLFHDERVINRPSKSPKYVYDRSYCEFFFNSQDMRKPLRKVPSIPGQINILMDNRYQNVTETDEPYLIHVPDFPCARTFNKLPRDPDFPSARTFDKLHRDQHFAFTKGLKEDDTYLVDLNNLWTQIQSKISQLQQTVQDRINVRKLPGEPDIVLPQILVAADMKVQEKADHGAPIDDDARQDEEICDESAQ